MVTGPLATPALEPEDPLAYLPCSKILEFGTGHVIYSPKNPPSALYVMIDGMVKVQRITENKAVLLVDIYRRDDLFGESAFTGSAENHEIATAMEITQVMAWTRHEIEQFMPKRPRLSLSLIQWLARRCQGLNERIEACTSDSLDRRLARTLIYFGMLCSWEPTLSTGC
jgi:CRP-like cAMP-binding protein